MACVCAFAYFLTKAITLSDVLVVI